uniref:Uncharacterized protein n=1 Tax=viral metagenome TaxID=1070528 RepID=A0A6C0E6Z2_9ZZZZ
MSITEIKTILDNPDAYYKIPKNENNANGKTIQCVACLIKYPYKSNYIHHYDIEKKNINMKYVDSGDKFTYNAPRRSNGEQVVVSVPNNMTDRLNYIYSLSETDQKNLDFIAMDLKDLQNNKTFTYNLDTTNNTSELQGFRLTTNSHSSIEVISLLIGNDIDFNIHIKKDDPYPDHSHIQTYPKELFKFSDDGQYIKISCKLLYWVLGYVLFLPIEIKKNNNVTYAELNHTTSITQEQLGTQPQLYAQVVKPKPKLDDNQHRGTQFGPPELPPRKIQPQTSKLESPQSSLKSFLRFFDRKTGKGGYRHKSKRTKKNTKRS